MKISTLSNVDHDKNNVIATLLQWWSIHVIWIFLLDNILVTMIIQKVYICPYNCLNIQPENRVSSTHLRKNKLKFKIKMLFTECFTSTHSRFTHSMPDYAVLYTFTFLISILHLLTIPVHTYFINHSDSSSYQ